MRYTVTWIPSARDVELTTIWLHAQDRGAVTKASHEIERKLRIDPEAQGQDFYGDRILEVWPLIVVFAVYPDDRLVEILQVRHVWLGTSRGNLTLEGIMNYLTADQALLERLAGVMEPVEIREASGKVLGRYTPVFSDEEEASERAAKYFDLAEAERTLAEQKDRGDSHAEVWKRIRAGEIQG